MKFGGQFNLENTLVEAQTGENIKIPDGKFAVWETIGSINTNAGRLEFFSGQSDKYHLDLSFTDGDRLKIPIIESKINFNEQIGRHEYNYSYPDRELFQSLENQEGFGQIYDNYVQSLVQKEESFLQTLDRESHVHKIYTHNFNINGTERDIELIHQTRGGDCVLANLINTTSFESQSGNISITIKEARELAIRLRNQRGMDARDIQLPDSALETSDAFYLFYNKLGSRPPQQNDLMNIDGRISENQLEEKVLDVIERIIQSNKGLCSVGMGIHSTSIKHIKSGLPNEFAIIDPMNPNGLEFLNMDQTVQRIKNGIRGQSLNNNFFCFID